MQQLYRGLSRLGVPICTLLLLARCGGSDLTLPSETGPADLALVDGNNQNGNEDCLMVIGPVAAVGNWNDLACNLALAFICEHD